MKVNLKDHLNQDHFKTGNGHLKADCNMDEQGNFTSISKDIADPHRRLVLSTADKLSALYESLEECAFKEIPSNADVEVYFQTASNIYTNYKKGIGFLDKIFAQGHIKRVENIYNKIKNLKEDPVYLLHKTIEHSGMVSAALMRVTKSGEINALKGEYCALHLAICKKDMVAIRQILAHGANITTLTRSGQSAFELALRTGDLDIIKKVWDSYSNETRKIMATGSKWAFILAETGDKPTMEWVLQNVVTGRSLADGHQFLVALEKAMQKNHVHVAQVLMKALDDVVTNVTTSELSSNRLIHFSMAVERLFERVSQASKEARDTGIQGVLHAQMKDSFENLRKRTTRLLDKYKTQIQAFQKNINTRSVSRATDLLKKILQSSDDSDIQQLQSLESLTTVLKEFPKKRLRSVIHTLDENGFSLLHYALMNKKITTKMLDLLYAKDFWKDIPLTKGGLHPLQLVRQNTDLESYAVDCELNCNGYSLQDAARYSTIARYGSARQLRYALGKLAHHTTLFDSAKLFIEAIKDKSKEKVQALLDLGFDITMLYKGTSPFMAAALSKDVELAQFVFSKLTQEQQRKELYPWTTHSVLRLQGSPLVHAIKNGDLHMVTWFLDQLKCFADPNNCLHAAALGYHLDILKLLLQKMYATVKDNEKRENGSFSLKQIEEFLPCYLEPLRIVRAQRRTSTSDQVIKELENSKADLERLKTELQQRQTTSLIHAVRVGDLNRVTQVLENVGRNIEDYDGEGYTAIHRAIQTKDKAKLKAVWGVLKSAPRNTQTGYTIAQVAVATGDVGIYSALRDFFQSASFTTTKEWSKMFPTYSAVYLAAKNGHLDMLRMLVEKEKYSPYSTNSGGTLATALHAAAEEGHLEIVEYLIEESRKRERLDREQHENGNFVSSPFIAEAFYSQRNFNSKTAAQLAADRAEKLPANDVTKKRYQTITTLLQPPRQEYISIEEPVPNVTSEKPSAPNQPNLSVEEGEEGSRSISAPSLSKALRSAPSAPSHIHFEESEAEGNPIKSVYPVLPDNHEVVLS